MIDFRTDAFGEGLPDGRRRCRPTTTSWSTRRQSGAGTSRRASYGDADPVRHHILSVLVENKAGVLARVAGLFARRGFNIYSPGRGARRRPRAFSRITIVVDAESAPLEQIIEAAGQADQRRGDHATSTRRTPSSASCCWRRSRPDPDQRGQVIQLVGVFEGEIVDVGPATAHRDAGRRPRPSSTTSRTLHPRPTGSSSCSGPAASRCLCWTEPITGADRPCRHGHQEKAGRTTWPRCTTRRMPTPASSGAARSPIIGYGSQGHAHALNLPRVRRRRPRRPARGLVLAGQGRGGRPAGAVGRRRRRRGRRDHGPRCPTPSRQRVYEAEIAPHLSAGRRACSSPTASTSASA